MLPETVFEWLQIGIIALCATMLAAIGLRDSIVAAGQRFWRRKADLAPLVLLFDKGVLIDTSTEAKTLLGCEDLIGVSWTQVRALLVTRLASLPTTLGDTKSPITLYPRNAKSSDLHATLEQWQDMSKLSVYNWPSQSRKKDQVIVATSEFESLTYAALDAPFPIWRMSASGNITWANPAFFDECGAKYNEAAHPNHLSFEIPVDLKSGDSFQVSYKSARHHDLRHFDITMISQGQSRMFFAVNADEAVRAEVARKNFVQTLSKTFAQLSTGLVIFDRDRRLVLYNPALVDQFDLDRVFLDANPTLADFFDSLRERRMIPEPRHYGTWREQLTQLVLAASDDRYREVWPLPSGVSFRVTGRPHPNGAVAFLFEDISAELSLERRFRAQLEFTQSIFDSLNTAIAVISASGTFTMTNAAFRDYWKVDPDETLANFTWADFEKIWQDRVKERHILSMVSNYMRLYHKKSPWERDIALDGNIVLKLRAEPVAGGYTMLTFELKPEFVRTGSEKLSVG